MGPARIVKMIRTPAVLGIAALVCLCQTAAAAPGLSVDVYPTTAGVQSTGYVASATSFQVDIVIAGVEAVAPLNGFEFDLNFDPGILVATNIADGGILLAPVFTVQETAGVMTVEFAEITLLPAGASGDGVLATITFDVIGLGVTALDLDAVVLSAPFGVEILATALNDGSIRSVPEPSASLAIGVGALMILQRIRQRSTHRRASRTLWSRHAC